MTLEEMIAEKVAMAILDAIDKLKIKGEIINREGLKEVPFVHAKDITALLDAHVASLGWKLDDCRKPNTLCTDCEYMENGCEGLTPPAAHSDVLEGRARKEG